MRFINRCVGLKSCLMSFGLSIVCIIALFILLSKYDTYIFKLDYQIWIKTPNPIATPCYELGMQATDKACFNRIVRSDGSAAPRLFFTKEREALRLLLEDIKRNGMNSEECTFFVVGPVFGLYQEMGMWEEAKIFLENALDFYEPTEYKYDLIVRLLESVNLEANQPKYKQKINFLLKRSDAFIKWYAPFIALLLLIATILFLIISSILLVRVVDNCRRRPAIHEDLPLP